ncbi:MAG: tetratricopeptide repeat protein [Chloroflexi bacterium]|nr:MAG: tetratricopeptide repeat protein [Chloroflexota bacterium]
MSNLNAAALHQQGVDLFRQDNPEAALEKLKAALEIAPEGSAKAAEICNDLGVVYRELEDYESAHQSLDKAMSLFTQLDNAKGQAQTLGNRAALLESQDKLEEAVEMYKKSAAMFEDLGENDMAMYVWQAVSRLRTGQGQYIAAIGAYEEGVSNMPKGSFKRKILEKILKAPGAFLGGAAAPVDPDDDEA